MGRGATHGRENDRPDHRRQPKRPAVRGRMFHRAVRGLAGGDRIVGGRPCGARDHPRRRRLRAQAGRPPAPGHRGWAPQVEGAAGVTGPGVGGRTRVARRLRRPQGPDPDHPARVRCVRRAGVAPVAGARGAGASVPHARPAAPDRVGGEARRTPRPSDPVWLRAIAGRPVRSGLHRQRRVQCLGVLHGGGGRGDLVPWREGADGAAVRRARFARPSVARGVRSRRRGRQGVKTGP